MLAGAAARFSLTTAVDARAIRFAVLACTEPGKRPDPRGLILIGANIHEVLDLSDVSVSVPLRFTNCVFHGQIRMQSANIPFLGLTDCEFRAGGIAVAAEGLAVSGDLVFDGLTAANSDNKSDTSNLSLNLPRASIGGRLVLKNAKLESARGVTLDLAGISVKGPAYLENVKAVAAKEGTALSLVEASIGGGLTFNTVKLRSTAGEALAAESLSVGNDTTLIKFTASARGGFDSCRLVGAKIGGTLSLDGARIESSFGTALDADRIEVGGAAYFSERMLARTRGPGSSAVSLVGAKIGGQLSFQDARLRAKHGTALYAPHVTVGGTASLQGARASGGLDSVQLGSAKIGAHLILNGARLTTTGRTALAAELITVDGQADFGRDFLASTRNRVFRAGSDRPIPNPAVALSGARIVGQLNLSGARLNNLRGTTLAADSVTIEADAFLDDLQHSFGFRHPNVRLVGARIRGKLDCRAFDVGQCVSELNLMHATVGTLRLNAAYGPRDPKDNSKWLVLDGLTYQGIPSDDMDVTGWIYTLKNRTPAYSAQPWRQLGMAHNAIGHDQDARRILIDQRVDYRDRLLVTTPGQSLWARSYIKCRRLWSHVLEVVTGFGYRSHRAFAFLLAVVAVSVGLTTLAGHVHVVSTPSKQRYVAQLSDRNSDGTPCSLAEEIGLGLQIGLPLIKTSVGDRCRLETASPPGQAFTYASWGLQGLAWAFATLAVAGYTGLIRKL
jgi:hypothetical protein